MKTNKLLSVVLTLCVLLAAFSLTALAAGDVAKVGGTTYATLAEAVADAADGDTVTLLGNTTEDVTVTGNITLDLGGFALKAGAPGALLKAGNRKELCMACFTGEYPTALYQSVDEANKDVKC